MSMKIFALSSVVVLCLALPSRAQESDSLVYEDGTVLILRAYEQDLRRMPRWALSVGPHANYIPFGVSAVRFSVMDPKGLNYSLEWGPRRAGAAGYFALLSKGKFHDKERVIARKKIGTQRNASTGVKQAIYKSYKGMLPLYINHALGPRFGYTQYGNSIFWPGDDGAYREFAVGVTYSNILTLRYKVSGDLGSGQKNRYYFREVHAELVHQIWPSSERDPRTLQGFHLQLDLRKMNARKPFFGTWFRVGGTRFFNVKEKYIFDVGIGLNWGGGKQKTKRRK